MAANRLATGAGKSLGHTLKNQVKNQVFNWGLAILATHELDAVTQREWRLFLIVNELPEPIARNIFVIAHVPLFILIFSLGFHEQADIRQ